MKEKTQSKLKKSIFILILLTATSLYAQKLKYRDIFTVIQSKLYEEAERLLKQYLADPKNADEANALYQLGLIYEMKALEKDVLTDSTSFSLLADSAIQNFTASYALINEKEVKRNEEYYQAFYRRDIRTGEFGIKVSDIKLDIEQRLDALNKKKEKMRRLHKVLVLVAEADLGLLGLYNKWTAEYKNYNDFVLRGGTVELQRLTEISNAVSNFEELVNELKNLSTELNLSVFIDEIKYRRLIGFKKQEPILDLSSGKIETWDVQRAIDDARKDISGDVASFKSLLKETDKAQEETTQKLQANEKTTVTVTIPKTLETWVNRYDPEGAPISLIKARIAQNSVLSLLNTGDQIIFPDSLKMSENENFCDSIVFLLSRISEYLDGIKGKVAEQENYYASFYFDRYKGEPLLLEKIDELVQWNKQQTEVWTSYQTFWNVMANYGISLSDTVELKISDSTSTSVWYTQKINSLGDTTLILGVKQDVQAGFVKVYNAMHKQIWQDLINLPFSTRDSVGQYIVESDTLMSIGLVIPYFYSSDTTTQENLVLSAYTQDGKNQWKFTIKSKKSPSYATFDAKSKITTIYFYPPELHPLPNEEKGYIQIDFKGKLKQ